MERNITGLVIGSKNNGDSSRTIEVLTAQQGIVYVFASGARRLSSRFLPLTNLFTLVSLECSQNGSMTVLRDGKYLGDFKGLEADFDKFRISADVIKNIRISIQACENKNGLYALCLTYFQLADECQSPDDNILEIASVTVKFYIYMLHFLGFDVPAYARSNPNGKALAKICEYLSGKRVSDAMTDKTIFENALEAYVVLADIYREMLDMRLESLI